jgi:hypothetical protein
MKLHVVAVDIKKKKVVSLDVTSEEVHDSKVMKKKLVDSVSENNDVKRVLADGAYDMIARRISSIYMMTMEWNRICHQGTKEFYWWSIKWLVVVAIRGN